MIRAEYFKTDTFAIKFYPKHCKKRKDRYSVITNVGDARNILYTVGSVFSMLIEKSPDSSIALTSTRSFDTTTNRVEPLNVNQRYRIYSSYLTRYVGNQTFTHFKYDEISCYLLVNNRVGNVSAKATEIEESFKRTFPDLLNYSSI